MVEKKEWMEAWHLQDPLLSRHQEVIDSENCLVCEIFELLIGFCALAMRVVSIARREYTHMGNTYLVFALISFALFIITKKWVRKNRKYTDALIMLVMVDAYSYCLCSGVFFNGDSPSITVYTVMIAAFCAFALPVVRNLLIQLGFAVAYCAAALYFKPVTSAQDIINYVVFYAMGVTLAKIIYANRRKYLCSIDQETQRQESLQNLLNEVPAGIGVYEISADGLRQLMFNEGFFLMLGAGAESRENYKGYDIIKVIHPDDLPMTQRHVKSIASGEEDGCDITYRSLVKDGNYQWVRWVGRVVRRVDGVATVYASITNVTERVHAQERQHIEETRQKELFDTVPTGILEFCFDGEKLQVKAANHTLLSMIDYTAEEFAAVDQWNVADVVHPEDMPRLHEAVNAVEIGKGKTFDFRLLNKGTGKYRWVSCDYSVTSRTAAGVTVMSAFLDIDDKRRVENEKAATTQFLSRMSHDMRTPMNGILGMAALAEDEADPAVLKREIGKMKESGEYLLCLINDTLDYQRIQSGRLELKPQICKAAAVIDNIADMAKVTADQKQVEFRVSRIGLDDTRCIRADVMRLKQIFMNLLSNAIKFTPPGGEVDWEIRILSKENNISHGVITVRDTGVGMSQAFLRDGIFQPFSQEYNEATNQYAGSGLGLSIVKSLVELMGGRIEVESEQNGGSTFRVYLDFELVDAAEAEAQLRATDTHSKASTANLKGKNILLVEDHPLNAEIGSRLLKKYGSEVRWEEDGQKGVDAFAESTPGTFDAILMDVRMPVMDGLAATRAIRALPRADAKTIPILAMTANAFDEDVRHCMEAGMNAHLRKPIDPTALYDTLNALLVETPKPSAPQNAQNAETMQTLAEH